MRNEDKKFLAELSAEMNTQDTNGQADPRYWVIMDSRWIVTNEGCGEEYHVVFDNEEYELNDFATMLIENYEHDEKREEETEEAFALCNCNEDLHDAITEFFNKDVANRHDCEFIEVKKDFYISSNTGIFLTKKDADAYFKANRHHFSKDAHVYSMTAIYNREQERLTEIIKNTNWEGL